MLTIPKIQTSSKKRENTWNCNSKFSRNTEHFTPYNLSQSELLEMWATTPATLSLPYFHITFPSLALTPYICFPVKATLVEKKTFSPIKERRKKKWETTPTEPSSANHLFIQQLTCWPWVVWNSWATAAKASELGNCGMVGMEFVGACASSEEAFTGGGGEPKKQRALGLKKSQHTPRPPPV